MINKIKLLFLIGGLFLWLSFTNAAQKNAHVQSPVLIKSALTNTNMLILATGSFDPKNQELNFSEVNVSNQASLRYGIVQFEDRAADFQWLQNKGFDVIQNLPNNAYLVNWSSQDKSLLDTNQKIRWYGAFQSGYKVSPNLWIQNRQVQATYQLSLVTFKDVSNFNLEGLVRKYFSQAKLIKTNIPDGYNQYVIEVAAGQLDDVITKLSANEDIQWLNIYKPQQFFNTEAVSATQATSFSGGSAGDDNYIPAVTPIWDQGIYGTGQIVGIADSGLDRNEDWFVHLDKGLGVVTAITDAQDVNPPLIGTLFPNNKVIAYWTMPGAAAYDNGTFHGTHVTGSVAGDREDSIGAGPAGSVSSPASHGYDNDDGMAPNAQILFNDIGSNAGLTGTGSTPMWQQAFAGGAAIHSNSYGAPTFGEYVGLDLRADQALRGLEDMIILFAAGNDNGQVNSTASPGNAKNVTTVGALLHGNSSSVAFFSNKGPTDDGRLKPDISATGSSIESAAGDLNNSNVVDNPSRRTTSGTSMSTPITAGSTALLRQYFMDGFYPSGTKTAADSITPSGPLMKASLLNGTNTDGGFFANNIGWGRVWLENSLYFTGDAKKMRFWEIPNAGGLQTGEQFTASVVIQAGEEFRATLVWYDIQGPTGSGVTLVNNLDLTVQQGTNTYLANNFTANNSITTGSADTVNTVEQVRFSAPVTGTYNITVDATNIPGNGTSGSDKQGFALIVSGDLSSGGAVPPNPTGPSALTAISNGLAGVDLGWSNVSTDYDSYEIYRIQGSCATADLTKLKYIGASGTNAFTDASTVGGYQYSYKIRAFSDDLISEYTNCVDIVSEQLCDLPPVFNQNSIAVTSNLNSSCQITLNWQAANSSCPSATDVQYNVYRSTSHNFIPNVSNLITTTGLNSTSFNDIAVLSGQPYYYIVKAEDTTTSGSGPNNGNESLEIREVATTALGVATSEGN
ncbi:MAG: S8 family serine peptidase, partial [Proteobacteria bacterium]|nr:S8 family serine peptidase [Pseudomonadota bacterium]